MSDTVQKFGFDVIAPTLTEVIDKLESLTLLITAQEGGEPWVVVEDNYTKVIHSETALAGDPNGSFYKGSRVVMFTGPSVMSSESVFRDGFKPQQNGE